jgi:hypothetical protein
MSFNVPLAESLPDISYVRANFAPLEQLCANRSEFVDDVMSWVHARAFPLPTYLLEEPGGSTLLMYPPDVFALVDEAGGIELLAASFQERFRRADVDGKFDAAAEMTGYLSGRYGACLQHVTPENIVSKETLVREITSMLVSPQPGDARWTQTLLQRVDALDTLERPFAECDRRFFGGPTSRDRCITAPRALYLEIGS